jgi:foldase protein PrsA
MFGMLLALALNRAFQTVQAFTTNVPPKYLQAAPAASATVAKVDGVEIKAKDVEDMLWQWRGADAVREMVEFQVVKAEADRRGISVTPAEIEVKLAEQLKGFVEQVPGKDVDDSLQLQGFTRSRAYMRVNRELLLEKMAGSDFHEADFVKISAITIKPVDGKTLEQAIAEADVAYAKLQKGSKWAEVLATTTADPGVLQAGGLLGWRRIKIFPESVAKEFETMTAGAYTKPTQTTAGVQIFRLELKGDKAPSEEVANLKSAYLAGQMQQLEKDLRTKAKIESYTPAKKS